MRRVRFDPNGLPEETRGWFDQWAKRAEAATKQTIANIEGGQDAGWKERVWKDLRDWLLEHVFGSKCAYCEGRVTIQSPGTADHYRPKGRVTERQSGRFRIVEREGVAHRGYYWLAYFWPNIIPCCENCNSGAGKQDQFPVEGDRVFERGGLRNAFDVNELNTVERPLLLHPYFDDPDQHLVFGVGGVVAAREESVRGEATIAVCQLQRGGLREDRRENQELVRDAVRAAFAKWALAGGALDQKLDSVFETFCGNRARYSACARHAAEECIREHVAEAVEAGSRDRTG